MKTDKELLLGLLEQELSAEEEMLLSKRLEQEPELREQLRRLKLLAQTLEETAADSFSPFFSDRLLQRMRGNHENNPAEVFYEKLSWLFLRIAGVCVLLIILFGALNISESESMSIIDGAFGMPSAHIGDIFFAGL